MENTSVWLASVDFIVNQAHLAGAVEYTVCFSADR